MKKPPHPCAQTGCRLTTDARYCVEHQPKRPNASALGYGSKWRRYSAEFIGENPWCCDPFNRHPGQCVPSSVTGHRVAHKGNREMLWNRANHYALCASCNAYQCARFEGGFGNARISQELSKADEKQNEMNNLRSGIQTSF